jgi:hypothetical protein
VCGDIYVCASPPENVRIEEWVTIVRMGGYVAGVPNGSCQAADPKCSDWEVSNYCQDVRLCSRGTQGELPGCRPPNVRIEEWVTIVRMWGHVAGVPKGSCQAADPQMFGLRSE